MESSKIIFSFSSFFFNENASGCFESADESADKQILSVQFELRISLEINNLGQKQKNKLNKKKTKNQEHHKDSAIILLQKIVNTASHFGLNLQIR